MSKPKLDRRAFLVGSAAAGGLLVSRGLGVHGLGGPAASTDFQSNLRTLMATLTPGQRESILLPADHPSRQITNTIAFLDRPHMGTLLSPSQQVLARRLCDGMLSEKGRHDFAGTFAIEGRFDGCVLAVYGDPAAGPSQATIMGGHVHLRGGDLPGEPLGGGVSYGHQLGNEVWKIPGNAFAHHGDAANRLFRSLDTRERSLAIAPQAPIELVLQPQADDGVFDGLALATTGVAGREAASALLDTVLSTQPEASARAALDVIDHRGGLDSLHVAFYESHGFYADMKAVATLDASERARRGDPYWQVWRIEGPGTVIHFQGYPHVHAYVQIVRDPLAWNVGETLTRTQETIEGEAMRSLLEAAMRRATGESLAFHAPEMPGRFCPGEISTGLAWTLDPYQNRVALVEIEGRAMASPLRDRLGAMGVPVDDASSHRIATLDFYAQSPDLIGHPTRIEIGSTRLGEALVDELRSTALG